MIKITHRQTEEGIEVSVNDDECGDGFKMLIKKEDFKDIDKGLENIFALAENYLNANYASLHKRVNRYNNADPTQINNIVN